MANPIIKIKRGNGEPPEWNGSIGITAGEFAFDRTTGMLYLGVTGQYLLASDSQGYQGLCALNGPFVIPVGAQISDDETFGRFNGDDYDNTSGNSPYTIPTTRAVRQYVLDQKAAASFGLTLEAGIGIELVYPSDDVLRFNNTGVIEGFRSLTFQAQGGGVLSGSSSVVAGSTQDVIKFLPQSGIGINVTPTTVGGIQTASIQLLNIGVTGINGATGNIKTFAPILGLCGSTAFVNDIAINSYVFDEESGNPISIGFDFTLYNPALGITQTYYFFRHNIPDPASYPVSDKTVGGYSNGYMYIPAITYDQWGHVKYSKGITLFGDGLIPTGLTEAVQDIVGAFIIPGSGINVNYDDNVTNTFTITNIGVTGIRDSDGTIATGPVTIQGGAGSYISVDVNDATDVVTISQNIPYFKSITTSGQNNPIAVTINATEKDDTLGILSGSGIRLIPDQGNQRFTIENYGVTGINGITGNVTLAAGSNISLNPVGNTITINAGGGGGGEIASINGEYLLDGTEPATGVTGFIGVVGLSYGFATLDDAGINYGKNILTFRSTNTENGQIYLDISPRVQIPLDGNSDASITIPPQSAYREGPALIDLGNLGGAYADNGIYTPMIYGGMTGAQLIDSEGNNVNDDSIPGKELILKSSGGAVDNGLGVVSLSAYDAVMVLSGYPTNNNFIRFLIDNGYLNGDCPEGNCVGFPPVIPGCDGGGSFEGSGGTTTVARGSATIVANTIIDGGLAVANDIFLTGNIYNSSGCKLDIGAASQASNYFDEYGTLRNPGGIYLNGSAADPSGDSNRAIFNVDEFFIKDRLVTIGGASGNNAPLNNGLFGTTMDVGFLMPSFIGGSERTAFIGIDTSDGNEGTFKFIPTASVTKEVTGNVGPAKFSTINNFGISGGNSIAILPSSNLSPISSTNRLVIKDLPGATADVSIKGTGHITFGGNNFITIDAGSSILMSTNTKFVQNLSTNGIFHIASTLSGLTFEQSSNSLQIKKRNASSQIGTYTFPSITTTTSVIVDTTSTQTLTAKTIGENCVIDCGSY